MMAQARQPHQSLTHKELGMLVALATFGMLFGTFFFTYLLARERFPVWPPIGVEPLRPFLPSIGTAVLVASSLLAHRAQQLFAHGDERGFRRLWTGGLALGFVFLVMQCLFWRQMMGLGVHAAGGHLFGAIFYVMTGLHAIHVVGGLGGLGWVLARSVRGRLPADSEAPKLAAWFWHFLDVVWVVMFALLVWY